MTQVSSGGSPWFIPQGLSPNGQVTGEMEVANGATHAFLGGVGPPQDLAPGSPAYSTGSGVNAAGQVTGYIETAQGDVAFRYSGGTMTTLTLAGSSYSVGNGINASGAITGEVRLPSGEYRAFIATDGTMVPIDASFGGDTYGKAINDTGRVTGGSKIGSQFHAFLYDGTTFTRLDEAYVGGGDAYSSIGNAISANGLVAGSFKAAFGAPDQAFIHDGVLRPLGTLRDQDLGGSVANGVNAAGQVVGDSSIDGSLDTHAFLYSSVLGMLDLNALVDPTSPLATYMTAGGSGITLLQGLAINESGQILAYGRDGSGNFGGYLLAPVPLPAAAWLMLSGLAALGAVARRRRAGVARAGQRHVAGA